MEEAEFDSVKGRYIGIDLGTTNSVVSYLENGKPKQVKFKISGKVLPSAIFFESPKQLVFGEKALRKGVTNPNHLLRGFKTDLGTSKKYEIFFDSEDESSDKEGKTYIIDTNIFLDEPEILKEFSESDTIKLPKKVIDELSYRLSHEDTDISAQAAIDSINDFKDNDNISFEDSDLSLLPDDLESDTKNSENDNRILSIAKKFESSDTYLITNDNGLKTKAETVVGGIQTLSLSEFRKLKNSTSSSTSKIKISPKELSRELLHYMKEVTENEIGEDVTSAVITVPANFTQAQIEATKEAGEEAGFSEISILKEPVAVGLTYAIEEKSNKRFLVFDFGGGTLDISIVRVENGVIEVEYTDGATLGGEDINKAFIEEHIFAKIEEITGVDMWDKNDSGLSQKDFDKNYLSIYNKAEDVKKEFSLTEKVDFSIPNFITPSGNMAVEFEITRNEFDSAIAEKRKEAIDLVKNLLANSGVKHTDIDEVVLAGGSSNIVSIREALKDTLGIDSKANKDTSTVISEGAILKAESDWGEGIVEKTKIINNTLYDFGVKLAGNKFFPLIPEGTTLPFSISKDFSTERDNQEEIKIEIFRKNGKLYPVANRIVDDGIEFVDSLTIENVPSRRVGEITVTVEFELTKDDTLSVDVSVKDRDGSEIGNKTTISKGSNG